MFSFPNLTITLGNIRITPFFWCFLIAFIFGSFSIWRRLREDHKEDEIFSTTLAAFFLAGIAAYFFSRFLSFGLAGGFLGIVAAVCLRHFNKPDIWEIFDSFALPLQFFLMAFGIGDFLSNWQWFNLLYLAVGVIGLFSYLYLKPNYRSFFWYKSGKNGFLFWSVGFFNSLLLFILAFFGQDALYFNRLLYGIIVIASVAVVYFRSGRKIQEDFRFVSIIRRKNDQ